MFGGGKKKQPLLVQWIVFIATLEGNTLKNGKDGHICSFTGFSHSLHKKLLSTTTASDARNTKTIKADSVV